MKVHSGGLVGPSRGIEVRGIKRFRIVEGWGGVRKSTGPGL